MTFQPPPSGEGPPPPPPGQWGPPPPPPGQWGPPPGGGSPAPRSGFDPKTVNPVDYVIMGISLLVFIFSFTDYVSAPFGYGINAWHFSHWTFLTWFGMVFGVLAGVAVALQIFAPQVRLRWPNRLLGLSLFTISFILYFIAIFLHFDFEGASHAFGFWISLVLVAIGAIASLMRVQQTGGQLPGRLSNLPNLGQYAPRGGIGDGSRQPPPPPPPPGYGPPPGQ